MKKALSIILAAGMLLTALAGCGATSSSTPASTPASTAGSTAASTAAEGDYAGQTLKVAAIETAYGTQIWEDVVAAFEAKTGATVELTMDKNLEDVIDPSMKAGDFPDVVHLAIGREKAMPETLIKENALEDLTDVLSMNVLGEDVTVGEKIIPGFTGNTTTNPYGDDRVFLMPMFYSPCGLFYDAGLFAEKGWEVPETWDDMWALAETAKADGISLFSYPTAGYLDAFTYAMMAEAGGQDMFNRALNYEEGIWETPEMTKMFDVLTKLASNTDPSVPSNANGDNFTKNQQLILDDKALFMPNGTWVVGEMADAPRAENFKWGFMALPALEEGGDRYSYTFFEQCWVPQGAENKDLAKVFISYLYSDEAAEIFAASAAVQPIAGMTDALSEENQLFYAVYDDGAKAAIGTFAATDPVEGVNMKDAMCFTMDSVVSGTKTQADWVAAVTAASDALRAALK